VRVGSSSSDILPFSALGLVLTALALFVYRASLGFGFNSDAFFLLDQARHGFVNALRWDGTYHYFPVASAYRWLLHLVFGLHQPCYQVMGILQHGILASLTLVLGRRLGLRWWSAMSAALLFCCAGNQYEVTLWSVTNINYQVPAFFCLVTLLLWIGSAAHRERWRVALIILSLTAALFAHEQSLPIVVACVAYSLCCQTHPRAGQSAGQHLATTATSLLDKTWILSPPLAVFLVVKLVMSCSTHVMSVIVDRDLAVRLLARALISLTTFRGGLVWIGSIMDRFEMVRQLWVLSLFCACTLIIIWFKWCTPLQRFLSVWIACHLLVMQVAIGLSPRHLYLPMIGWTILWASVVERFLTWLGRRLSPRTGRTAAVVLPVFLLTLFLVPSYRDLIQAQQRWSLVDQATKSLQTCVHAAADDSAVSSLVIANATRDASFPNYAVFTFQNGLAELVAMVAPSRFDRLALVHTHAGTNAANGSRWVDAEGWHTLCTNPQNAVLVFDRQRFRFTRITALSPID